MGSIVRFVSTDPMASSAGLFDVSLWGKNLGNKDYRTFIYAAPATAQLNPTLPGTTTAASFGEPRTYGISVNFKY